MLWFGIPFEAVARARGHGFLRLRAQDDRVAFPSDTKSIKRVGQECPTHTGSPHGQIFCGFQRRAAFSADDGAAVSADERIGDFDGAVGAIERFLIRKGFGGHQE